MTSSPTHSHTPQSAAEELIVAQALAFYRDSKQVAENAPHGQFLNHAEAVIITKGREFLRNTLQTLSQEKIHDLEKKKRHGSVRNAKRKGNTSVTETKTSSPPPEKST